MKIQAYCPIAFATGDRLDPRDLVAAESYCQSAIEEAFSRRYKRWSVVIPLAKAAGTGYTEIDNIENRTFSFKPPFAVTLEKAYISGSAAVTSGKYVYVNVTNAAGSTPTGVTNPILRFDGSTTDFTPFPVRFDAATEYDFRIEPSDGTTTFTTSGTWLELHFVSDRWATRAAAPTWTGLGAITAATPLNASVVSAALSDLASTAALGATNLTAPTAHLVVFHNVTNARSSTTLSLPLPRYYSGKSQGVVTGIHAWSYCSATGPTVTWALKNSSGTTLASVSSALSGTTANGQTACSVDLTSATTAIASTTASDYSLVCSSNSATNVDKTYCWIFINPA